MYVSVDFSISDLADSVEFYVDDCVVTSSGVEVNIVRGNCYSQGRKSSKFMLYLLLTDTGPKKCSPQDCVSFSWKFRSAPLSTPLLIFREKFERENSHGP